MAHIPVIDPQTATGEAKTLLDAVQSALGMVPNFIRVLANSHGSSGLSRAARHCRGRDA